MRYTEPVCGPNSALGLDDTERIWWPHLRERLRQPGRLMALMRGVLGGDAEVAVVVAVEPNGVVRPLAILVTSEIAAEIVLGNRPEGADECVGTIGGDPAELLLDPTAAEAEPIAILMTPWIFEHLTLYARKLWSRR